MLVGRPRLHLPVLGLALLAPGSVSVSISSPATGENLFNLCITCVSHNAGRVRRSHVCRLGCDDASRAIVLATGQSILSRWLLALRRVPAMHIRTVDIARSERSYIASLRWSCISTVVGRGL